ncbi:MAG: response regulator [Nitrospirae bacterium]|nr:MAG: response regulator [Nitrospirota bacterium]
MGVRLTPMSGAMRKTQSSPETILLVDDDEPIRVLVRERLEQSGYTVLEACFNSEALLIARRHEGLIHLMIADVMMPGINGRELAYMLASSHPHMKVLYISGYPLEVVREKLRAPDMANFLQKPFPIETLVSKVRELLKADPAS